MLICFWEEFYRGFSGDLLPCRDIVAFPKERTVFREDLMSMLFLTCSWGRMPNAKMLGR